MNLQEKYNEYKQRQEAKKFFNQNNDYVELSWRNYNTLPLGESALSSGARTRLCRSPSAPDRGLCQVLSFSTFAAKYTTYNDTAQKPLMSSNAAGINPNATLSCGKINRARQTAHVT